jgi:hypothetical protein
MIIRALINIEIFYCFRFYSFFGTNSSLMVFILKLICIIIYFLLIFMDFLINLDILFIFIIFLIYFFKNCLIIQVNVILIFFHVYLVHLNYLKMTYLMINYSTLINIFKIINQKMIH